MGASEVGSPVGWGVVGTGWVAGDSVAPAISARPSSRLAACLGSSRAKGEAFAARFGVERVHEDLATLLGDPAVDAVYVALPNAMHREVVLAAARAGKHVLCEKPFALRAAHAREMTRACADAGVVLRVAHQIRLDAAVARAREIVRSGRLGRPVAISLERSSGLAARSTWRNDASQSGVVFDVGVHLLDLVQWITGERYLEVGALTHPDRRDGVPDDTVTVLGRLCGGCQAVVRATREVRHAENALLVEGTEATLSTSALRFAREHAVTVRGDGGAETERFGASPAYALEIEAFESDLGGGRSALPDGEDATRTVAVTEAVLRSIAERQTVRVEYPG